MTNFVSVGTAAARCQDLSLNPQKLAGQCAKLKCCLNFEVDTYMESTKELPPKDIRLETADSTYYHFKTDIFKKEITYSTDKNLAANLVTIDAARAFEVIEMNKAGEKPLKLELESDKKATPKVLDLATQESLTRFDKSKKKKKKKKSSDKGARPDDQTSKSQSQPKAKTQNQPQGGDEKQGQRSRRRKKGQNAQGGGRPDAPKAQAPQKPSDNA